MCSAPIGDSPPVRSRHRSLTRPVAIYDNVNFKALTCFADAEREPMRDMLVPIDWTGVKQYFLSEGPRLPRLA